MSKYKSIPTTVDGIKFASKKEARRYGELKLLQRAGAIKDLRWQVRFPLYAAESVETNYIPRGEIEVAVYVADFVYQENGKEVLEDVKSPATRTQLYRLKRKLMLANYGIDIKET